MLTSAVLVVASMGFAASFAWVMGSTYGLFLSITMVLMAVGIELGKPLAFSAAISALREWRLIPALALSTAGLAAVAFSATAELSLNATMRGDLVAQRSSNADEVASANARYLRVEYELTALAPSRPAAEIQAELDGLLLRPGVDGCREINGPITKEVCPRVAELRAEAARAQRRGELLLELKSAEADRKASPAVSQADPGAAALSAYFAALGVPVPTEKLSLWLPLIAVLALQTGSATSALLVQAMRPKPVEPAVPASQTPEKGSGTPMDPDPPSAGTEPSDRRGIAKWLAAHANGAAISIRKLARETGLSKSALHRELHRLKEAGLLVLETTSSGTKLRAA
ncbi:helix-turn-helix domain-containing protein [Hyphomicrobium sp. CS1GBMeth3]|uniref:MarR family transcriptional regulator n=1 Tax=Hyphomicrobium sp. CS1GBMeth3 TaxID=1892845 RepID=UPI001558A800|nr:helix-turn-helix domain-containing protein [Hyphomicrobium sp. CS1GBMeth3]